MKTLPVRRSHDDDRPADPRDGGERWNPFWELDRLSRIMSPESLWRDLEDAFIPLADVEELDDAYVVEIELPGVRREDIDVELSGRELVVTGERKEKERVGILRRRERTTGQFRYEVLLPGDVDEDDVEAGLDDGVLMLRLPKPERERPRRIEIG